MTARNKQLGACLEACEGSRISRPTRVNQADDRYLGETIANK